ncbi:MAG: sugar phosphate isomerase/epimerase family protein [Eubacteriales bacterium]|jgi:sugar phosphate isomerase/epimerase
MSTTKISVLTNVIVNSGVKNLRDVAELAASLGFSGLEVGPTLPLDEHAFEEVLTNGIVDISALIYCRNYLSTDAEEANFHIQELKKRILFASKFDIPVIVTSTGIDKSIEEGVYDKADSIRKIPARSLNEFERVFTPIVDLAENHGVKIAFENCPLMGNIAISPAMWELIFERIKSDNIGLAYDPSHLVWQHIDPYLYILDFSDKIFHFHAKDTQIDRKKLGKYGFLTDFSWWKYRIVGDGEIDWTRLRDLLKQARYNGAISIEHEDSRYEGSFELVNEGLKKGLEFLKKTFAD